MSRPIVLSNSSLHVGLNEFAEVHDFYYPYVGLDNHAAGRGMRHRVGVWVDGQFSWIDDGSWRIKQTYIKDTLIGLSTASNANLGVTLEFHDTVDSEYDAFLRSIHIINHSQSTRNIRLFMHQVFLIANSLSGDTAQYLPGETAVVHYKGHNTFIIGADALGDQTFDQYAVGVFGIEGKDGTFKDAEDGELSGNAVEHGRVDSCVRINTHIEPHGSTRAHYWIACGKSFKAATTLHKEIIRDGLQHRQRVTSQSWHFWLEKSAAVRDNIPRGYKDAFTKSLLLTKSHCDSRGGVIASTDTAMLNYSRDAYAYCWPRDGAYALWPLLRIGYRDELQRFFEFCRRGLSDDGYLMHKYQTDGALGSSWHPYIYAGKPEPPIQEDETALVLFLCGQYYEHSGDQFFLKHYYPILIRPMANFLNNYIDHDTKLPHASYDLWEEKFLTSTYTTAVVYGALRAAADLAREVGDNASAITWDSCAGDIQEAAKTKLYNESRGFFYKGFLMNKDGLDYDDTIDMSSFYGAFMFNLFGLHSREMKQSYQTICNVFSVADDPKVVTPLPRYERDRYNAVDPNAPNPWFITTTWLAQYYLEIGEDARARRILSWVRNNMMSSGVLSEQIHPFNGSFISVAPLTWSQSEFMNAVLDLTATPNNHTSENAHRPHA